MLLRVKLRLHPVNGDARITSPRGTWLVWGTSLAAALVIGFMAALAATRHLAPGVTVNPLPSMVDCIQRDFDRIGAKNVASQDIETVSALCWKEISFQGRLNDFEVRRLAFYQQYYSNPVLLWMVVIVTLSGVGLAGVQLIASFELAQARGTSLGQDGQLEVEKGKIALKSSVTGLFILVMSFAFFMVFIRFVYRIEQEHTDTPAVSTRPAGPELPPQALVPAPPPPSAPSKPGSPN